LKTLHEEKRERKAPSQLRRNERVPSLAEKKREGLFRSERREKNNAEKVGAVKGEGEGGGEKHLSLRRKGDPGACGYRAQKKERQPRL